MWIKGSWERMPHSHHSNSKPWRTKVLSALLLYILQPSPHIIRTNFKGYFFYLHLPRLFNWFKSKMVSSRGELWRNFHFHVNMMILFHSAPFHFLEKKKEEKTKVHYSNSSAKLDKACWSQGNAVIRPNTNTKVQPTWPEDHANRAHLKKSHWVKQCHAELGIHVSCSLT